MNRRSKKLFAQFRRLYFTQLVKKADFIAVFALALLSVSSAVAELSAHHIEIAPRTTESRVRKTTAQGHFLQPQAVSVVDISTDGKFIMIGTMTFSHDANVWLFATR